MCLRASSRFVTLAFTNILVRFVGSYSQVRTLPKEAKAFCICSVDKKSRGNPISISQHSLLYSTNASFCPHCVSQKKSTHLEMDGGFGQQGCPCHKYVQIALMPNQDETFECP
jgi:hypothetical protein